MAKKSTKLGDAEKQQEGTYLIRRPSIGIIRVPIRGITPLVVHAWSAKARGKMLANQQKGDEKGTGAKESKAKRNPTEDYNGARYVFKDKKGEWDGVPAVAFKASLVESCRQVAGLTMTDARRMLFVRYDGVTHYHSPYSCKTEIGLVRIYGEPEMREDAVRINNGRSTDLCFRPQYWPWTAMLQIEFNASLLKPDAIVNLVATAGYWEGVCEWRPGSKQSNSGQLGRWEVDDSKTVG